MSHMDRSALFLLADRVLEGRLEATLRNYRRAGLSRRAATKLLAIELGGIDIDPNTIARWMAAIKDANGDEEAA